MADINTLKSLGIFLFLTLFAQPRCYATGKRMAQMTNYASGKHLKPEAHPMALLTIILVAGKGLSQGTLSQKI